MQGIRTHRAHALELCRKKVANSEPLSQGQARLLIDTVDELTRKLERMERASELRSVGA